MRILHVVGVMFCVSLFCVIVRS